MTSNTSEHNVSDMHYTLQSIVLFPLGPNSRRKKSLLFQHLPPPPKKKKKKKVEREVEKAAECFRPPLKMLITSTFQM